MNNFPRNQIKIGHKKKETKNHADVIKLTTHTHTPSPTICGKSPNILAYIQATKQTRVGIC